MPRFAHRPTRCCWRSRKVRTRPSGPWRTWAASPNYAKCGGSYWDRWPTSAAGGEAVRQEIAPENLELLRATLLAAKQQVGEADGRVLFVYLPSDTYYSPDWAKQHILATRTQVLGIAKALDLETLDLTPEFDGHPIESRFVFSGSHYNREGNEIVASAIVAAARRTRPN